MANIRRPGFADIDVWGVTHPGRVRRTNQDHYFAGALSRGLTIDRTSLAEDVAAGSRPERLASLAVVADGVGGSADGERAARVATLALVEEVARSFHEAAHEEATDPEAFSRLLLDAVATCHSSLLQKAEEETGGGHFATTLTLFLGLWPHAYLLQVGDSRCYLFQHGELMQITRDQTWAQALVDAGILTRTKALESRWAGVLASAIGGSEATPVVTRIQRDWGAVVLLCSDGLTRHVSDDRIRDRCAAMESSRQLCESLLQDALDDGGSDNITIVVGRTMKGPGSSA